MNRLGAKVMVLLNTTLVDLVDGQRRLEQKNQDVSNEVRTMCRTLDILDGTLSSIQTAQDIHSTDLTCLRKGQERLEGALSAKAAPDNHYEVIIQSIQRIELKQAALERVIGTLSRSRTSLLNMIISETIAIGLVVLSYFLFRNISNEIYGYVQTCAADLPKCVSVLASSWL